MNALLLLLAAALLCACATTRTPRTPQPRAEFVRANPCPATGKLRSACPGYVVDHIKPLCAGGADHPDNMQWQTIADAKIKDREERKMCSAAPVRASFLDDDLFHGGGLNKCGCHMNRSTATCHCHRPKGCGCNCQPATCK